MITVRLYEEKDFERAFILSASVRRLHQEKRPDIYRGDEALKDMDWAACFRQSVCEDNTVALVAELDGAVVGFCQLKWKESSRQPALQERSVMAMEEICVEESCRGKGVGTALCREAAAQAEKAGADALELMVWGFNSQAETFYRRLGMKIKYTAMEMPLR